MHGLNANGSLAGCHHAHREGVPLVGRREQLLARNHPDVGFATGTGLQLDGISAGPEDQVVAGLRHPDGHRDDGIAGVLQGETMVATRRVRPTASGASDALTSTKAPTSSVPSTRSTAASSDSDVAVTRNGVKPDRTSQERGGRNTNWTSPFCLGNSPTSAGSNVRPPGRGPLHGEGHLLDNVTAIANPSAYPCFSARSNGRSGFDELHDNATFVHARPLDGEAEEVAALRAPEIVICLRILIFAPALVTYPHERLTSPGWLKAEDSMDALVEDYQPGDKDS